MSFVATQMQLGRDLAELNSKTIRKLTELQVDGIRQYFETNQEFAKKIPEIRDMQSFVELQREYGKTLWEGIQEDLKTRNEVVRDAFETGGELLKGAFGQAAEEAANTAAEAAAKPTAVVKPTAPAAKTAAQKAPAAKKKAPARKAATAKSATPDAS